MTIYGFEKGYNDYKAFKKFTQQKTYDELMQASLFVRRFAFEKQSFKNTYRIYI